MINDFLKKYQSELISKKIDLKEDMDLLDTKIKEESKFLSLLQDTNDSYFSDFSPRELNVKNNEKALEINDLLKKLESTQLSNQEQMKFLENRLSEVNSLINNFDINSNVSISNDAFVDSSISISNDNLKSQLCDLKSLILLDPYKASLDLQKIIDNM